MSTPQPAAPAEQDTSGVGTTGPDGAYTPAPPIQRPGEPPVVNDAPRLPPAPPAPGEPGYVGPPPPVPAAP